MKKSVCPGPQRGVERPHVPLLHLHVLLVDEVNVVVDDRRRLLLGARHQLHFGAVGPEDVREAPVGRLRALRGGGFLAGHRLASAGQRVARRHHLGRERRHVRHGEADVVERGAAVGAARLLLIEEEHDAREAHDVGAADLGRRASQRVHPELAVLGHAGGLHVEVPHHDRRLCVEELRGRARHGGHEHQCRDDHQMNADAILHGADVLLARAEPPWRRSQRRRISSTSRTFEKSSVQSGVPARPGAASTRTAAHQRGEILRACAATMTQADVALSPGPRR